MRKLLRIVFLFLFFSTAVVACNTTDEACAEDCKKECCAEKKADTCDEDCDKPCCADKNEASDSLGKGNVEGNGDEQAHTCSQECKDNPEGCPHHG